MMKKKKLSRVQGIIGCFLTTFDFSFIFHLKNCSPCLVWCCFLFFYQNNLPFLTGQLSFHSDTLYNTYFPDWT